MYYNDKLHLKTEISAAKRIAQSFQKSTFNWLTDVKLFFKKIHWRTEIKIRAIKIHLDIFFILCYDKKSG
jgi:hypothetical protein